MEHTLTVRNLTLGSGAPKIIVPIVEPTEEGILAKAQQLSAHDFQILEWRVDHFDHWDDPDVVCRVLQGLRQRLEDKVILFTFRTLQEGGQRAIDPEAYIQLNTQVARSGAADLVDVEIFMGDAIVRRAIDAIHAEGCLVVGSNHDFQTTPPQEELVRRLRKMQDMGADIPKIAVMANDPQDVLTLLSATYEMHSRYADRPILTMSMRGLGSISRMAGEIFGSCATFGAVGQGSAPGQVSADDLAQVLRIIHQANG